MIDRLAEKILYLKEINNIKTIKSLAEMINIPYTTLKDITDGITTNIRLETGKKICDFFDLTLDELFRNEIDLPEFIENDNKNSILKMKRKYPLNKN